MNMRVLKDKTKIKYLYHYTKKENIDSILQTKQIKSTDDYIFFTNSIEKSIELFETEMMSNHYYIDLDCQLKRRVPAKKEDYCIIQIPYKNDGKFVKFVFDNEDRNSIYTKSTIHKGTLYFEKAKVIDFFNYTQEDYDGYNLFKKLKFLYISIAASFVLTLPKTVYADSWYDYKDISWNHYIQYSLSLTSAEQLAGLSYLANSNQLSFFSCSYYNNKLHIPANLDLSTHDWITFDSKCFCLCGIHRIILKQGQNLGIRTCSSRDQLYQLYRCSMTLRSSQYGTSYIDKTTALTGEKVIITAIPNDGVSLNGIKINGSLWPLSYFSNEGENKYGYTVSTNNVTIEPNYIRQSYYATYNIGTGATANGNYMYYKGDTYSIPVKVHPAYKITSIRVNGEETILENGYINGTVTGPLTIDVETKKVGYPEIKDESNSIVIDFTKIKNSLELSYVQLEAISFLLNNNIIKAKQTYETIGVCETTKSISSIDSTTIHNLSNACYNKYSLIAYTDIEDKDLMDVDNNYSYYQRIPDFIDEPIFGPGGEMAVRASAVDPKISIPGPIYNSSDFTYFTASDGTTPEDNIYYELTSEDKEIRNYQGDLIFEKYDNIIIKFGEYNVNENKKKDIVIDYSNTDNYCDSPQIFIPYLIDKGVINEEYDEETNTMKLTNKEGKVLAITDTNYYLLEVGEDITEEDNIEIEIDDEFTEAFPNISSIYNKVSLVFANTNEATPEEEKNNSIIDILVNPKTGHNILFSIIFIALLTITTIYYKNNKKV